MNASCLSLIALIVAIFLPTAVVGRLVCDAHCASGCSKYGSGHCDLYCQPRATWRLRVFDHTCQPRCGGHCLYCRSYYYCDVCWKGYQLVLNSLGQRLCKIVPPVCDIHCADPKNCQNAGQCNGPCVTGYQVNSTKQCSPICDTHCIANGCTTQGSRHCDATCVNNYVILSSPVYICAGCDPNCFPTTPPGCDSTTLGGCTTNCSAGYALNLVTGSCDQCPSTCSTCTTTASCDTCATNTIGLPTCAACDPNCSGGCTTAGYCDTPGTCNTGYGPTATSPKKCGACDANCSSVCTAQGAGKCDIGCNAGYTLDATTYTCAPCQTPNPSYCSSCSAAGTCTACTSGHTLTSGYCT
jgi:hypothetical protein